MKTTSLCIAALFLSACAGNPSFESKAAKPAFYDAARIAPTTHVQTIKTVLSSRLKDPASARYKIGNPTLATCKANPRNRDQIKAWSVLANVNAKNSYGAYAGNTEYEFFFSGNAMLGYMPTAKNALRFCAMPGSILEDIKAGRAPKQLNLSS